MSGVFIGVDFGGSSLKAVSADPQGRVLESRVIAAGGKVPRHELLDAARAAAAAVAGGRAIARIGLAFGGAIQPDGAMREESTNLANLAGLPLVSFFAAELGCAVRIDNDARAALRGEAWSGAARGALNAMAITFGTGIGSGLMIDRRIVAGGHGRAGEIGVWTLGAAPVTFEDAAAPGRVEARTGRTFSDFFLKGEAHEMIALIGRAIANAHLLLDLEAVVLLGGVMALGEPLRQAIEAAFTAACPEDYRSGFEIKLGVHGALAGAVGAAALWREEAV